MEFTQRSLELSSTFCAFDADYEIYLASSSSLKDVRLLESSTLKIKIRNQKWRKFYLLFLCWLVSFTRGSFFSNSWFFLLLWFLDDRSWLHWDSTLLCHLALPVVQLNFVIKAQNLSFFHPVLKELEKVLKIMVKKPTYLFCFLVQLFPFVPNDFWNFRQSCSCKRKNTQLTVKILVYLPGYSVLSTGLLLLLKSIYAESGRLIPCAAAFSSFFCFLVFFFVSAGVAVFALAWFSLPPPAVAVILPSPADV